jgi:glycosyltransferase involved in cell wall biosynthesis
MKQSKRILFVVYELPPIGGGVANAAHHLLTEFAKDPHLTIDVVTSSTRNCFSAEQFSDNIIIHSVPIGPKPPSQYQRQTTLEMIRFLLSSFWKITALQFQHRYDVAHYFGYPGAFIGLFYFWNVPYIVSLRGVDTPEYNQRFGWYYKLYKPLAALTWRYAQSLTAPSRYLIDLAQQSFPNARIALIPNGVDTGLFRPLPDSKKHKKFTVTAGGTIMGKKKGLDLLIKGFAQFHAKYPKSQLILFGEGDEYENLQQFARMLELTSTVIFKGKVSHTRLAQELPKCHVFCLPSHAEGMSNALIEAQAAGLAVVTTPVGNGQDLIDAGLALPITHDVSTIADALEKLSVNPNLLKQIGTKARTITKEMTWKNIAQRYKNLYA